MQHVFIKSMKIVDGALLIIDEKSRVYSMNLKTRKIRKARMAA